MSNLRIVRHYDGTRNSSSRLTEKLCSSDEEGIMNEGMKWRRSKWQMRAPSNLATVQRHNRRPSVSHFLLLCYIYSHTYCARVTLQHNITIRVPVKLSQLQYYYNRHIGLLIFTLVNIHDEIKSVLQYLKCNRHILIFTLVNIHDEVKSVKFKPAN